MPAHNAIFSESPRNPARREAFSGIARRAPLKLPESHVGKKAQQDVDAGKSHSAVLLAVPQARGLQGGTPALRSDEVSLWVWSRGRNVGEIPRF
jgi:hypothetical protein